MSQPCLSWILQKMQLTLGLPGQASPPSDRPWSRVGSAWLLGLLWLFPGWGKGKIYPFSFFNFSPATSSSLQEDRCGEASELGPSQLLVRQSCSMPSSSASPKHCSVSPRRSLLGCQRLQSSPSLASIAWFPSPQLQKTRRADQCAAAQSTRLWLCGVTPNPGRQQGGRGFSKGRAWGEEACRDKEGEVDPG